MSRRKRTEEEPEAEPEAGREARDKEFVERVEKLLEKYKEVRRMAEEQRRAYAIKIAAEESDGIHVKYRLLLRPTQRGIVHLLEIMEEGEVRSAIQVPLLGDWERALKHADRVIDAISKETFREVARVLVEMQRRGGITGAGAQEVE
ncbi:MAG: hypothetical protein LM577_08125 [Thermoproteaceae archaeon]|nr:hypothetical protein [Thermoproteaceae archaeon]